MKQAQPDKKAVVRCAIYTRVSTDEQAKGRYSSLKAQRDICENYIAVHKEDNWVPTGYFEDSGYSGKNMERPGIRSMLGELDAGNVDIVVAYKIDRVTRSLRDFYEFWERLEQHHVGFASATQSFDTSSSMGMLMLNILLSFGQYERELSSERTADKLQERAKKGKWNGGWVPIGFEYDKKEQTLRPHPEESRFIQEIFELTVKFKNATAVAHELNKMGKRTRKRTLTRKDGTERVVGEKRFIGERVKAIIRNPIYRGVIRHDADEYDAEHKGLVTEKLWDEANAALKPRLTQHIQKRDKHVHLLKGLLKCGHCGTSLTPYPAGKKDKDGNPYLYYTCTHVVKEGTEAHCPVRSLPARAFEDLILGFIGEMAKQPALIKETMVASTEAQLKVVRPLRTKLATYQKKHKDLAEAVRTCIESAKAKGAKKIGEEFIAEAERLAIEKNDVEHQINRLRVEIDQKERVLADEKLIADSLCRFNELRKHLPAEDQKELVRMFIYEVVVNATDPSEVGKDEPSGVNQSKSTSTGEKLNRAIFETKIRTKWYRVNLGLYGSGLFSEVLNKVGPSSDFRLNGSGDRARTCNILVNSQTLYH
jgi:site-specific DNA recombinase